MHFFSLKCTEASAFFFCPLISIKFMSSLQSPCQLLLDYSWLVEQYSQAKNYYVRVEMPNTSGYVFKQR